MHLRRESVHCNFVKTYANCLSKPSVGIQDSCIIDIFFEKLPKLSHHDWYIYFFRPGRPLFPSYQQGHSSSQENNSYYCYKCNHYTNVALLEVDFIFERPDSCNVSVYRHKNTIRSENRVEELSKINQNTGNANW